MSMEFPEFARQHAALDALVGDARPVALRGLHRYYDTPALSPRGYTGSEFDNFAGGGDTKDRDTITYADILSLTTLSMGRDFGQLAIAAHPGRLYVDDPKTKGDIGSLHSAWLRHTLYCR